MTLRFAWRLRQHIFIVLSTIIVIAPSYARADGRVAFLAERVSYPPPEGKPDDFRVRTNAALALGATDSDEAVAPLCSALADPSSVVRQAAAVAMRRLARRSALPCLQNSVSGESNGAVKLELQRAISSIVNGPASGSSARPPADTNTSAKYYISLGRVANSTRRREGDIAQVVSRAVSEKLASLGAYEMAPAGEANDHATAVLAKRKLKGFYLAVHAAVLDYTAQGLRARIEIAVFSYPNKELRGEVPASALLPDAKPGDTASEDRLLATVTEHAIELFADNFK